MLEGPPYDELITGCPNAGTPSNPTVSVQFPYRGNGALLQLLLKSISYLCNAQTCLGYVMFFVAAFHPGF